MVGETGPWVILILSLVALSFYLTQHQPKLVQQYVPRLLSKPTPKRMVVATPAPTPAPSSVTAAESTPEPLSAPEPITVSTPEPTPPPVPKMAPTPAPEPALVFSTIAANPALWPKQVMLISQRAFAIAFNGKVVGQAQAPAGTLLQLVRVLPDAANPQVEVLFQNSREIIPVAAIDLMQRALALQNAAPARPLAQAAPMIAPIAASQPAPVAGKSAINTPKFSDRVTVEIIRQRQKRIVDTYDDKQDDVSMKIKLYNNDPTTTFENLKCSIYLFGENLLDRNMVKMLGKESFDFSLPPRGNFERVTAQVSSGRYDESNDSSRYGCRYGGWLFQVTDSNGKVLLEKSAAPSVLNFANALIKADVGKEINRTTGQ